MKLDDRVVLVLLLNNLDEDVDCDKLNLLLIGVLRAVDDRGEPLGLLLKLFLLRVLLDHAENLASQLKSLENGTRASYAFLFS